MKVPFRRIAVWAAILLVGAILLSGRYDWHEAAGLYAKRGYLSSLYFFLLTLPASYFLTLRLSGSPRIARVAGALFFVALSFPHHWLRLARYPLVLRDWRSVPGPLSIGTLAAGLRGVDLPGEWFLFGGLALAFAIGAFLVAGKGAGRVRRLAPICGAFFFILLQTWAHSSMRSPNTYIPVADRAHPAAWYHVYMFPDARGAVGADQPLHTMLDDHFNGVPKPISTMLIRRSFEAYLLAPFTYGINSYYVYLVFNPLLWLLTVLCLYYYVRRIGCSDRAAFLTAAIACAGNGFICFVAQPQSYLASYAIVAISLFLYEELLVARSDLLLFGLCFGLCSLTYDTFPLYPMFVVYGLLRRVRTRTTLIALGISALIYAGFLVVQFQLLGLPNSTANTQFMTMALGNIATSIGKLDLGWLYSSSSTLLPVYAKDLAYGFFFVAFALALLALVVGPHRRLLAILLLPTFVTTAVFHFGGVKFLGTPFGEIPRLVYLAYPAIYLGAALTLERTARYAKAAPWAIAGALALWHNADLFGQTILYYHYYWP